jgi:hypothetical protein
LRTRIFIFYLFAGVLGGLCLPSTALSQGAGGTTPEMRIGAVQTNGAYYRYARQGALTNTVYVLGSINAGIYEIERGTRLSELFVLASGATIGERTRYDRSKTIVRLYRSDEEGGRELLQENELENLLTDESLNIEMMEDDILVVEVQVRTRMSWRDGLSVATALAAVSLAIERIVAN